MATCSGDLLKAVQVDSVCRDHLKCEHNEQHPERHLFEPIGEHVKIRSAPFAVWRILLVALPARPQKNPMLW